MASKLLDNHLKLLLFVNIVASEDLIHFGNPVREIFFLATKLWSLKDDHLFFNQSNLFSQVPKRNDDG